MVKVDEDGIRLSPDAAHVAVGDRAPRRPGIAKGRLTDAFFEPLTDDELPPEE